MPNPGPNVRYQAVRPSEMVFDERVNRPPNAAAARRFRRSGFKPEALSTPELWEREDGALVVIDGLQRMTFCLSVSYDERVVCKVHVGIGLQQACALFRSVNVRTPLAVVQDFLKGVTGGDPECMAIDAIVAEHQLAVDSRPTAHVVTCVEKLRAIYRKDPAALGRTLAIAIGAFGYSRETYHSMIVMGIGLVVMRDGDRFEDADMARKIAVVKDPSPKRLLDDADFWRTHVGASKPDCVAAVVVQRYNTNRRSRALAPWFS